MKIKNDEMTEAIIAAVTGSVSKDEAAKLAPLRNSKPNVAKLWNEIEIIDRRLRHAAGQCPASLDQRVRDLIQNGVPEDPWRILLEISQEHCSESSFVMSNSRPYREAASVEHCDSTPSLESILGAQLPNIHQFKENDGSHVLIAASGLGLWLGVVVSDRSVPVEGIRVELSDARGNIIEAITDARGSFAVDCERTPLWLSVGGNASRHEL